MEDFNKKTTVESGDKEILYSKTIKAGKRIYYLDVKKNLREDLFIAITESKKVQSKDGAQVSFEKHKIFLYKEDFDNFLGGMEDVIAFIRSATVENESESEHTVEENSILDSGEIKLNIEF